MSDQYLGEIRAVSYNFAPSGWAVCNGQLMAIAQNAALFSLLGTTYGGDGRVTFGLPNLAGASPLAPGQGPGLSRISLGENGGAAQVTLVSTEMPAHSHAVGVVDDAGDQDSPKNAALAQAGEGRDASDQYGPGGTGVALTPMSPQMLGRAGGSQPHNNMPPYLVVTFIIALQGVYPPRG
jgi:microcystin-dependent protein